MNDKTIREQTPDYVRYSDDTVSSPSQKPPTAQESAQDTYHQEGQMKSLSSSSSLTNVKPPQEKSFFQKAGDFFSNVFSHSTSKSTHPEFKKRMPVIATGKWGTSNIGQDAVNFYGKDDAFGIFTNTQREMPIKVEGVEYKSSEHYFQASKFPPGSAARRNVENSNEFGKLPGVARSQTGPKTYDTAHDHDTAKKNMWRGMVAKFNTYQDAKDALLATGDKVLVENTSLLDRKVTNRESTWGAGDDGNGENRLGIFLMAMREQIKRDGKISEEPPFWLLANLQDMEPKQIQYMLSDPW